MYALFSSLKSTFDTIQESTEECAAHICDFFQHSVALQWPDDDDGTIKTLISNHAPENASISETALQNGLIKSCLENEVHFAVPFALMKVLVAVLFNGYVDIKDINDVDAAKSPTESPFSIVGHISRVIVKLRCGMQGHNRLSQAWNYTLRHPNAKPCFGELFDIKDMLLKIGEGKFKEEQENAKQIKEKQDERDENKIRLAIESLRSKDIENLCQLAISSYPFGSIDKTNSKRWINTVNGRAGLDKKQNITLKNLNVTKVKN